MSGISHYYDYIMQAHVVAVALFMVILFSRVVVMGARSETVIEKFSRRMRIPNMVLVPLMIITGILLLIGRYDKVGDIDKYMLAKLVLVIIALPLAAIGVRRKTLSMVGIALVVYSLAMALAFFQPGAEDGNLTADDSLIIDDDTSRADQLRRDTTITEEERLLLQGKQVFLERGCGSCHGVNGFSGFQSAKNLEASKLNEDQIIQVVTNGRASMPPLRKSIPEEEMKSLVKYVINLRKPLVADPPPDLSR